MYVVREEGAREEVDGGSSVPELQSFRVNGMLGLTNTGPKNNDDATHSAKAQDWKCSQQSEREAETAGSSRSWIHRRAGRGRRGRTACYISSRQPTELRLLQSFHRPFSSFVVLSSPPKLSLNRSRGRREVSGHPTFFVSRVATLRPGVTYPVPQSGVPSPFCRDFWGWC